MAPYDAYCSQMNEEGVSTLGSRVFGDCDKLMSEVMKNILSKEDLGEWLGGREQRRATYDLKRKL